LYISALVANKRVHYVSVGGSHLPLTPRFSTPVPVETTTASLRCPHASATPLFVFHCTRHFADQSGHHRRQSFLYRCDFSLEQLAVEVSRTVIRTRRNIGKKRIRRKPVGVYILHKLTTWYFLHSPAVLRCFSNQLLSPAGRAHSSKPAAEGRVRWTDRRTDRWTNNILFHRPCSACYAGSANEPDRVSATFSMQRS